MNVTCEINDYSNPSQPKIKVHIPEPMREGDKND